MAHQRIPAFHKHGSEKPGTPSDDMTAEGFADVLPFRSPNSSGDLQSVLTRIAELAKILTAASGAAIAFKSEKGTICRARSGEDGPALGAPVNTSTGISKQCLDTGKPQRCDDVRNDDRVDRQVSQVIGIRAIAVVPILQGGLISGILAVFSRTAGTFTDRHLKMLEHLASLVESPTNLVLEGSSPVPAEPAPSTVNDPSSQSEINLLVEPESAYRVFFHNLADLASRPASPLPTSSKLDYGWNHVFVESQLPWERFIQSFILHIAVIVIGLGLGEIWPRQLTVPSRPIRPAQITYYPAAEAYPTTPRKPALTEKRRTQPRAHQTRQAAVEKPREVLKVPRGKGSQRAEATNVNAPNLRMGQNQKLAIGGSASVLPAPPLAGGSQSRRLGLPGDAIVAPAPEVGGSPGTRRLTAPGAQVVPPSPDVAATMRAGGSRLGGGVGGDADAAIPPPPAINGHKGLTYRGGSGQTSQAGVQVVGPPPSLQAGTVGGRGNTVSLGAGGAEVVPPPALLDGNGSSLGKGRGNAIAGGPEVVPPPPSEISEGKYGAGGRLGSLTGTSTQVVPPPPSVQGGGSGGTWQGRMGSLAGNGSDVAGPAPSVEGGSNTLGGGRGGAVAQLGSEGGLPPAAGQGGAGGGTTPANAANDADAPKSKIAEKQAQPAAQDVQLRLISVAWSPPRSSYFSNYEVFIAEKWTNKQPQLIKLVYVFLPYQRRLSEYGSDAKVRKLRVTRDRSCDESLMQMEWPDDKSPAGANQSGNGADPADRNNKLPCYRTTADDYRRAITGTR